MSFSVYSRGLLAGDRISYALLSPDEVGIFESLRTYGEEIFRKEEHVRRFLESAQTAGLKGILEKDTARELDLALDAFRKEHPEAGDLFIRLMLWRKEVRVMIGERIHPPALYEKGASLKTSPVRRSLSNASPPEAKTSAYQNAAFASLEPKTPAVFEWLFLDNSGTVTEVRTGNLFLAKDGSLATPPTAGILDGVTRRFVIECARKIGIPVRETPLTRHDVFNAGEAFLTNTSWEILPVAELDGRRIGRTVPGPVTLKLRQIFRQRTMGKNR